MGKQRQTDLYAAHAARLYAYARRHGGSAAAEDLVADAFVIALRRIDDVPTDPGEARAWLIGTVRKTRGQPSTARDVPGGLVARRYTRGVARPGRRFR